MCKSCVFTPFTHVNEYELALAHRGGTTGDAAPTHAQHPRLAPPNTGGDSICQGA
jgi:hypothetical protein